MNGTITLKDLNGLKPRFNKSGNIKLGGRVWAWSTMYGNTKRSVAAFGGKTCTGTCGGNCAGCENKCYVSTSYRYPSVVKSHAINTTWLKSDPAGTFSHLRGLLARARRRPDFVRINQSGELMNASELVEWARMSVENPATSFYVYTKNYDAVRELVASGILDPHTKNFTVLISIWHQYGASEYRDLIKYDFIKAFVYDDGDIAPGCEPQTYCHAYKTVKTKTGKDRVVLDHDITCEKCKKCFNRSAGCKIIGCKAH